MNRTHEYFKFGYSWFSPERRVLLSLPVFCSGHVRMTILGNIPRMNRCNQIWSAAFRTKNSLEEHAITPRVLSPYAVRQNICFKSCSSFQFMVSTPAPPDPEPRVLRVSQFPTGCQNLAGSKTVISFSGSEPYLPPG